MFQFRLKTLLLVVFIVAILIGIPIGLPGMPSILRAGIVVVGLVSCAGACSLVPVLLVVLFTTHERTTSTRGSRKISIEWADSSRPALHTFCLYAYGPPWRGCVVTADSNYAMPKPRFTLTSLLLLSAAAPLWIGLFVVITRSPGWGGGYARFVLVPLVLAGITAAIHRLLRGRSNAWPITALLAGFIVAASLVIVSWYASLQ